MMKFLLPMMLALNASAAEKFSISSWKAEFARAIEMKNSSEISRLTRIPSLEKKAVPTCLDCKSKSQMRRARELFENGQFNEALKIYNNIPKSSDYWLEAVEERGWAHFRNEDYEKAIAQTKTLLSPQFSKVVNSEAYFLQSLSQLRLCDYQAILDTHKKFKEKQKERIQAIQSLQSTGSNPALNQILSDVDEFPLKFEAFKETPNTLPLLFYRDLEFQRQFFRFKLANAGLEVLPEMTSKLKSDFDQMKASSLGALKARLKVLAQEETQKNARILQKLNLVEVETIQRIHTDQQLAENLYKENKFKTVKDDQLVFADDGQPWIDELDKYDVVAKSCPKNIRRKM